MSAVVVAGGLGDMGRLITDALRETGKYEVYVMSRRVCVKGTGLDSFVHLMGPVLFKP